MSFNKTNDILDGFSNESVPMWKNTVEIDINGNIHYKPLKKTCC